MYFKTYNGTPTFDKLKAVYKEVFFAESAASSLAAKYDTDEWVSPQYVLAGGIIGLQLKAKPSGWKKVCTNNYNDVFFPKASKSNAAIIEEFKALPTVPFEWLNDAVSFTSQRIGNRRFFCPTAFFGNEFCLIVVNDLCTYSPPYGVIEITKTEFEELKKQLEDATNNG